MQKSLTRLVAFLLAFAPCFYLFVTATGKNVWHFQPDIQAATLVINEYQADPADGLAGDANGDGTRSASQDEFVEVVNNGSQPLDVSGFTISDAAQVRFTIPQGKSSRLGKPQWSSAAAHRPELLAMPAITDSSLLSEVRG